MLFRSTNTTARGVAYWRGDADNPLRIIFFTAGNYLNALNANTGKVDRGYGKEGKVDIAVPWNGVPRKQPCHPDSARWRRTRPETSPR